MLDMTKPDLELHNRLPGLASSLFGSARSADNSYINLLSVMCQHKIYNSGEKYE